MGNESQIVNILNDILKVEAIEEAFSCIIVHNTNNEKAKITGWQTEMTNAMMGLTTEQQENAIRKFLYTSAEITNYRRMHLILTLLEKLVSNNVLPARLVCECILSCDKLKYQNEEFWIKCFTLVRHIIGGVDYKGVRDVLKACREKAHSLPTRLDASVQPQMKALENLVEYIFDRNACLIPSYLIIDELEKNAENKIWPHWLAKLISNFVTSFRNVVQIVSIIGHSKMLPVVEHTGYGDHSVTPWVLDRNTLQFTLKGNLPYDPELLKPQTDLLRYVLEQPYSRDMVCSMLGLQNKQNTRCAALEEQLVDLVIRTMEKSENEPTPVEGVDGVTTNHWPWLHLSSQIICHVLSQFASFPSFVTAIHEKLAGREWKKSRDHLMWVLLQFISGSIQRKPIAVFFPIFKLYDLLYPEKDPLPVPDLTQSICAHQMACVSIWLHLVKKIHPDHTNFHKLIPYNLKTHHEFLQHMAVQNTPLSMGSDYKIALLCNAYSTSNELFSRPMSVLVESVLGTQKNQQQQPLQNLQNNSALSNSPTAPLPMSILDSLTVHVKMSLIHSILTHVAKSASTKSNLPLPPALVETYSRLLVYTEIENIGIKKFISHLLPTVFKAHAWGILYTLLDMFSYRMHHIQPTYRVQILSHLHSLASVPQTNQTQLHLCVESTALRLITGLGSAEVQPHLSKFLSEPKTLVSADSEELNRALVLTIARSMHITGTGGDTNRDVNSIWCKDLLNTIMQNTPHSWAEHTLRCFPPALSEFFQQNSIPKEEKQQIKKAVEEEYRNWASMSNENDIIAHFSVPNSAPLFLCLIWKMILETDRVNPIVYKILERIGARALSAHVRKFCDYIVFEVSSTAADGIYVNKSVDAINHMIWKYNIVTFDRLVLCLALRTLEGNEAQVCFFIIQLLLLKATEFRNRVVEFVKENSPDHWKQSNWHEKHLAFHKKFPEKFAPEGMMDQSSGSPNQYQSFPAYFGNVCLRFLPVLDIVMHRYLEVPQVTKSLEVLLDHLGCLYRFHDRPVTYLYNTLHYYERKLRDQHFLKRRLVTAILGSLKEIRAPGWALSEAYQRYTARSTDDVKWQPELDYYVRLVQRLVETISGRAQFPSTDWRFNEFPNPTAHTLYVTCVELMALPVAPNVVANNLLDVVAKGYTIIPSDEIHVWINCIGIIMTALPECYWSTLHDRLVETITSPGLTSWQYDNLSPFQLFNFNLTHNSFLENKYSYMLALAHSIWHHAGVGQITAMTRFVKERIQPVVNNEEQLIFVCHLIGPTLTRMNIERPRCVNDLTEILYEMLEQVNRLQTHLKQMDPVCDLFYHIKYMFVGDAMKNNVDGIIRRLRPALQMRLRFIAHLSIDNIPCS
ncbi:mediator of RNA polymerase II transcription subunit 23 [Nasonia vitripennis]|uniref:Mediator of RNA polymerase II transcription subunit 23 n=1 Tax=Nasonia vitripennis TaxID=7425 RepID=A0A7M7HHX5_NASVI|nr:mediator of RNA polymerase II transcription subunit 23 [Nasonia vitripennis]XP_008216795.1 mediator of RNA polymerase II transcription subunit 23 [Nasonia vitripennis]XP_008216796.1 mediator of RNA polymerase II transcription subunit 23 [Nasonia vitripennis]XP_016844821.1 mediator of RNA polymerase II transcription subunit 23 [Nasonia vitripennis]